jgi:hypothetical protein
MSDFPHVSRKNIVIRRANFLRPLVEVVTSFTCASAVLSTVLTAVLSAVLAATRVDQLVYFGGAFVLGRRNHRDREFPLGAIACLHDFTDAQTAMLGGDVRLLTIS